MNKRKVISWIIAIVLVFLAGWSAVYVKHAEKINSIKIAKEEKKNSCKKKRIRLRTCAERLAGTNHLRRKSILMLLPMRIYGLKSQKKSNDYR